MKKIGVALLVIGLIGLLVTLGLDTTVEGSGYGNRIHNIGLMNQKQNLLIVFVAMTIAGVIFLSVGARKQQVPQSQDNPAPTRTCPYCAERIMAQAIVCRYCGRATVPVESGLHGNSSSSTPSIQSDPAPSVPGKAEAFSTSNGDTDGHSEGMSAVIMRISSFTIGLEKYLPIVAVLSVVVGLISLVYFGVFADFSDAGESADGRRNYRLKAAALLCLAGVFIAFRNKLRKPKTAKNLVGSDTSLQHSTAGPFNVHLLGKSVDLIVVQSVLMASIFMLYHNGSIKSAYIIAMLAVALGYALVTRGSRIFGSLSMVGALLFLAYWHLWFDDFLYSVNHFDVMVRAEIPFKEIYVWLLLASVAIPHLQLLGLGALRYGDLRGDASFNILGHEICVPFASALIFYVLWAALAAFSKILYYSI